MATDPMDEKALARMLERFDSGTLKTATSQMYAHLMAAEIRRLWANARKMHDDFCKVVSYLPGND